MNYQNFCRELVESVKAQLGENYQVSITNIEKNNGIIAEGMMIRKENSDISPNIYLEHFYDKYREGESLEETVEEILVMYRSALKQNPVCHIEQLKELKKHEKDIFFRLVNYEMNKDFLERVPHVRYLDFAITFHCLLEKQEYGIQSFCINEIIRQGWGICTEKLYQIALKNTPLLFPPQIQCLEDMMYEMIGKTKTSTSSEKWFSPEKQEDWEKYEEKLEDILEHIEDTSQMNMYVMTNHMGNYGAGVLLYPNLLECFAKKVEGDFYLLPSSIHEWIVVVRQEEFTPENLREMVIEVNRLYVDCEEVLSNQVYFYNSKTKEIEVVLQDKRTVYAKQ